MTDDWWMDSDVPIARDEEQCEDGWHYVGEEPTQPCPTCGDAP